MRFMLVLLPVAVAGCARAAPPPAPARAHPVTPMETTLAPLVMRQYADMAHAVYDDAAAAAARLLVAVDRLRAAPSAGALAAARAAWLAARRPYLQSEALRFYDGPIDRVEMAINTWPIDEGYLESENGSPPGIIDGDATYPEISAALIADLNAKEGETSISAGYHVIEFLLWGRDRRADGPGDRPFNDYLASGPARGRSAALARRRGIYLHLATELLVGQLRALAGEWGAERGDNYRANFLRLAPREALARIIKGMGVLGGGELAGERLTVAYETKDQENEHSCFSDNTHNDVLLDARGIENVYLGRYQRDDGGAVSGPGVYDWVVLANAGLGLRLKTEVAASVAAAGAIPAPFDQAILGNDQQPGRRAILATIQALQRQSDTLAEVAATFDIALNLTAPTGARAGRAGSPAVSALPGRP